MYANSLGENKAIDKMFFALRKKVDREARNQRQLMGLQGAIDLLLGASTSNQKPELRCEEVAYRNSVKEKAKTSGNDGLLKHSQMSWNKVLLY